MCCSLKRNYSVDRERKLNNFYNSLLIITKGINFPIFFNTTHSLHLYFLDFSRLSADVIL